MRRRLSGWVVAGKRAAVFFLLGMGAGAAGAPFALGQNETPFSIRVEAADVVVPVVVLDRTHRRIAGPSGYEELDEEVADLRVKDFHVFEDGVEQPVESVSRELTRVRDVRDNFSHHIEYANTPSGVWASADLWPEAGSGLTVAPPAIYLISYVPPASSRGSCHKLRVLVRRRHATVYARDEYCDVMQALSDPIGASALGRQMAEYADSGEAGDFPLAVQVGALFGDAHTSRVDVAVEFPWNAVKRKWVGVNLYATVAVLGMVRDKNGRVVARFSDVDSAAPWNFYRGPLPAEGEFLRDWESAGIPARYETQVELAPGEYELSVVVSDGSRFGRMAVPAKVEGPRENDLAISDIVLCKRFHEVMEGAQAAAGAAKYVPLASDGKEFTAAGDTRFRRGERFVSYFEIFSNATQDAKFRVRAIDAKSGEVRIDTGWNSVRMKQGIFPMAVELDIGELARGEYLVEVEAGDAASGRVKRVKVFTVE